MQRFPISRLIQIISFRRSSPLTTLVLEFEYAVGRNRNIKSIFICTSMEEEASNSSHECFCICFCNAPLQVCKRNRDSVVNTHLHSHYSSSHISHLPLQSPRNIDQHAVVCVAPHFGVHLQCCSIVVLCAG